MTGGALTAQLLYPDVQRGFSTLTDTTHQLSAQTPITVRNNTFTATLPPRSLVTYDIKS